MRSDGSARMPSMLEESRRIPTSPSDLDKAIASADTSVVSRPRKLSERYSPGPPRSKLTQTAKKVQMARRDVPFGVASSRYPEAIVCGAVGRQRSAHSAPGSAARGSMERESIGDDLWSL